MSDEYNPPEKVAQALANDTVYWLLQLKREVKLVKNIEEVGTDGLLLRIDIIRVTGGVFRRVDAKYQVLNNETNETIIDKMDAYKTRFGYNKITRKLGKKLAIKVNNLIDCFENGRNKT